MLTDDDNAINMDALAATMDALNPHADDAVQITLPAFFVHLELCQGQVGIALHPRVAAGLRDYLDRELEGTPDADPAWARDLDPSEAN